MTIIPLFWKGYVMGKWFSDIKVKPINDENLTIKNMVLREFVGFYLIGIVTLGIAFIISAIMIYRRKDNRGIHDLIGSTYVIEVD